MLSGCAGPETTGPARAAADFARAVSVADGELACALLSEQVSSTLTDSTGMPCPAAVLQEGLPAASPVRQVQRYGHRALVTTDTDTVFLSEFPTGWRIIGAGCRPRGERPYDCAVSGG
jgi:hypothetical protein